MERAAEGKPEQQYGDTVIPAEDPDWRELKTASSKVVAQSKDLRAAVYLTRALLHTDGYAGLADGLMLIRGYIETYWESLYPLLDPEDDNDPTIRINTLLNLCDPIHFLQEINRIPVVASPVLGKISFRDIQIAEGVLSPTEQDNPELSLDQVNGVFKDCPKEEIQQTATQIQQSIECVQAIETALDKQVGVDQSPDIQALANLLKEAAKEISKRTGEDISPAPVEETAMDSPAAPAQETASGSLDLIRNRDDVLRALERICLYYEQNEPSSPVPLLLKRAMRLVKKDFFEIVQDLAPDGSSHFDFLWKQDEDKT
jgi:type VI secretion system protein ImpA